VKKRGGKRGRKDGAILKRSDESVDGHLSGAGEHIADDQLEKLRKLMCPKNERQGDPSADPAGERT